MQLGAVIGGINQRRGSIVDTEVRDDEFTATAEVALNDMFGYAGQLRGMTQGKGEFSMEYSVSLVSLVVMGLGTDCPDSDLSTETRPSAA